MMKRRSKLMAWIVTLFWLLSLFTVGCAQKSVVKETVTGGEAVAQKESATGATSEKGTAAGGKTVADKSKKRTR
jgi:outer membrane lipoprotein-sorting protein